MSNYISISDKDYKYLMINNSRGRTNHVVYYDAVEDQFLPVCRASRGLDMEAGLQDKRYILSKSPVAGASICKACVIKLLEDDLLDINLKFDRHLIEVEVPGYRGSTKKVFRERGMTHKEYALEVNRESK